MAFVMGKFMAVNQLLRTARAFVVCLLFVPLLSWAAGKQAEGQKIWDAIDTRIQNAFEAELATINNLTELNMSRIQGDRLSGTDAEFPVALKQRLVKQLREHYNVFIWSFDEMSKFSKRHNQPGCIDKIKGLKSKELAEFDAQIKVIDGAELGKPSGRRKAFENVFKLVGETGLMSRLSQAEVMLRFECLMSTSQ